MTHLQLLSSLFSYFLIVMHLGFFRILCNYLLDIYRKLLRCHEVFSLLILYNNFFLHAKLLTYQLSV